MTWRDVRCDAVGRDGRPCGRLLFRVRTAHRLRIEKRCPRCRRVLLLVVDA